MKKAMSMVLIVLVIGVFSMVQAQQVDTLMRQLFKGHYGKFARDTIEIACVEEEAEGPLILQFTSRNEEFSTEELTQLCLFTSWYFERSFGNTMTGADLMFSRVEFIEQYNDKEPVVEVVELREFVGLWGMAQYIPNDEILTNEEILAFIHKLFDLNKQE